MRSRPNHHAHHAHQHERSPGRYSLGEGELAHFHRFCALARWLDTRYRIPGTKIRIGMDPILGLVPGVGDTLSAALSVYLVYCAAQIEVPRALLVRMLANVALDTLVGSIPLLGDVFDVVWTANERNRYLLEDYLAQPDRVRKSSNHRVALWATALLMFVASLAAAMLWIGQALLRWLGSL